MIIVKRFSGKEFVVNCELIEFIEATPDTVVTLVSGNKLVVLDTVEELIEKIVAFKRSVNSCVKVKKIQKAKEE